MSEFDDLVEDLKRMRDELQLKMHLAGRDLEDEWDSLETRMNEFSGQARQFADEADLQKTGEDLGVALLQVGRELKLGYERIRDALK